VNPTNGIRVDREGALYSEGPSGLGGWLALPIIGLILTALLAGTTLIGDVFPAFQPNTWTALTSPGSPAYHALWGPLIVFDAAAGSVMLVAPIFLLVLLFQKKLMLPRLMIYFYLFTLVAVAVDSAGTVAIAGAFPELMSQVKTDAIGGIARGALGAAIWIPYFLYSKRVRNTFVN
jgi:hypothetical protein